MLTITCKDSTRRLVAVTSRPPSVSAVSSAVSDDARPETGLKQAQAVDGSTDSMLAGWDEGVVTMKVGEKATLDISR